MHLNAKRCVQISLWFAHALMPVASAAIVLPACVRTMVGEKRKAPGIGVTTLGDFEKFNAPAQRYTLLRDWLRMPVVNMGHIVVVCDDPWRNQTRYIMKNYKRWLTNSTINNQKISRTTDLGRFILEKIPAVAHNLLVVEPNQTPEHVGSWADAVFQIELLEWVLLTSDRKTPNGRDRWPSGFDEEDFVAAELSSWIYSPRKTVPLTLQIQGAIVAKRRKIVASFKELYHADVTRGYTSCVAVVRVSFTAALGKPERDVIYVVWRGTESALDVMTDLNIIYDHSEYREYGLGVHAAVHVEVKNRWPELQAHLPLYLRKQRIAITGHSLGGAFATAFFAYLKLKVDPQRRLAANPLDPQLVTFASPMVFARLPTVVFADTAGHQQLRQAFDGARNYLYRDDPVPRCYGALQRRKLMMALDEEFGITGMFNSWVLRLGAGKDTSLQILQLWEAFKSDITYDLLSDDYLHVTEQWLLQGDKRGGWQSDNCNPWKGFELRSSSIHNHSMNNYVEALLGGRLEKFPPETRDAHVECIRTQIWPDEFTAIIATGKSLMWRYNDVNPAAHYNPLRWSKMKSVVDLKAELEGLDAETKKRPVAVASELCTAEKAWTFASTIMGSQVPSLLNGIKTIPEKVGFDPKKECQIKQFQSINALLSYMSWFPAQEHDEM